MQKKKFILLFILVGILISFISIFVLSNVQFGSTQPSTDKYNLKLIKFTGLEKYLITDFTEI